MCYPNKQINELNGNENIIIEKHLQTADAFFLLWRQRVY